MHSENINELASALAKAQGEMEPASKSIENTFFKSKYADLAAIVAAARVPLSKHGLAVIQTTDYDGEQISLETMLVHSSGQWKSSRYPVRPVKNDPQGVVSAITYARRTSYAAMVGVVSEDEDDDGEAASGRPAQAKTETATGPDRKAAATKWGNEALDVIRAFTDLKKLSDWHTANANAIAAVRGFNETLHGKISKAIQERESVLHPMAAE